MKTVAATEAKNRLGAILDDAQREPIVIRRQDRDIAVVLSMAEYERLRAGNIQAFLDLRNEVATQAAASGLTDDRLAGVAPGLAWLGVSQRCSRKSRFGSYAGCVVCDALLKVMALSQCGMNKLTPSIMYRRD